MKDTLTLCNGFVDQHTIVYYHNGYSNQIPLIGCACMCVFVGKTICTQVINIKRAANTNSYYCWTQSHNTQTIQYIYIADTLVQRCLK